MKVSIVIKNIIKYNRVFYKIYYNCGTLLLHCLKIIVKPNDKMILFNSYGGRKFDDSPRAVYEAMLEDTRFKDFQIIWGFNQPEQYDIPVGEKVKTDTLAYYITALRSRIWITNSAIERGLSFKGKNTIYYNSWHGTPIKKLGNDIVKQNSAFKARTINYTDVYSAQSKYEKKVMAQAFDIPQEKYQICGYPRNDILANYTQKDWKEKRKLLGIPEDKKVILFAPTFREYKRDVLGNCITDWALDFNQIYNELGSQYIILLRAHYEAIKTVNLPQLSDFIFDVSDYPELNDLMIASDMLVSDYSSIFFDYAILNKPMICYAYDYDEYSKIRGVYFDIRKEIPNASESMQNLIEEIKKISSIEGYRKNLEQVSCFREKYVESYGNASEYILNILYEMLISK